MGAFFLCHMFDLVLDDAILTGRDKYCRAISERKKDGRSMDINNRFRRFRGLDLRSLIVEALTIVLWIVGVAAAIFIATLG